MVDVNSELELKRIEVRKKILNIEQEISELENEILKIRNGIEVLLVNKDILEFELNNL